MVDLYGELLDAGSGSTGSRGDNVELLGVTLRLTKPRARLSRSEDRGKPFSALGELLWYLSISDRLDFIEPYISKYRKDAEDGILYGAYGPRLFAMRDIDQVSNVIKLLREKSSSKRAVIQLFNAEDIQRPHKEIPCTTTMQFLCRDGRLHLSVTMRSNDAYYGLPHDVFCFTMLQEMMSRSLGLGLGEYFHYVGSMHIYEEFIEDAKRYREEGHQRTVEMPEMPMGDPFHDVVPALCSFEDRLRHGEAVNATAEAPNAYWADIFRLYQTFWASGDGATLDALSQAFVTPIYRNYVDGRRSMPQRKLLSRRANA
ncbi:thymidylate synthase [Devosia sp. A16]|uniref:thymidylate synthase n=1 Tax=Devosia sp. A16 TaxID=1736675 RepID=UPI001F225089|nr:thymidylate synthase [Devosia sp. A16]